MTPAMIETARLLKAHPAFEWRQAMLQGQTDARGEWHYNRVSGTYNIDIRRRGWSEWLPVLNDNATGGVLLATFRDTLPEGSSVCVEWVLDRWRLSWRTPDRKALPSELFDPMFDEALVWCDTLAHAAALAWLAVHAE